MPNVPTAPISLDEVRRLYPAIRQSTLSNFDDCALQALFDMRYAGGYSTHPQARGIILHRVFNACLIEMKRQDSEVIPIEVALAILEETLRQRDVPPEEIVRVPLREIPLMVMATVKFARDNAFSIRDVLATERGLTATITYRSEDGELIEREVTGRPDVIISRPPDECVIIDWKTGFGIAPLRDEDADDPGLSWHGFFQQRLYAWLAFRTWPAIKAVTLSEYYVYRSQSRPARLVRSDLPEIERWLSVLVEQYDRALMAGAPPSLKLDDLERHGHWKPSPGKQCGWCPKASLCPIDSDYSGVITTPEQAARAAGARQIAKSVNKRLTETLKVWVDVHGPVPVKRSKGRLLLGYRTIKGGKLLFSEYTPTEADRPSTEVAYDPNALADAMKEATERARAERGRERVA